MDMEEFYKNVAYLRGIGDLEDICQECSGLGVKTYGSTSTWRGGVGGQTMTNGPCNKCWGSGDKNRPWPSHRLLKE